jgi:hypothetical protein
MSGHDRQGIDSTAFDSLLTMSNSTIKLVLIVRDVFSGPPTYQALGCAIVPETSCRAGKFTSRTLM